MSVSTEENLMKKILITILVLTLAAGCLSACGKKEEIPAETVPAVTEEKTTAPETTEETTEPETEKKGNEDLLTGLYDLPDEAVGLRPVAVAVNNVEPARPQYNISKADVVFELPVEAGLTRMLAVYPDMVNLPYICSVRSYRYYFPPMALGFDAFYVHWGEDNTMMNYYYSLDMDYYDGIWETGFFYRDEGRLSQGYDLEHTSAFDGTQFYATAQADGKRLELGENYKGEAFLFNPDETVVPADGDKCVEATINFGSQNSGFVYNEKEKKYFKYMNGTAHMDGITEEAVSFTNVFILETYVADREDGYHKTVEWHGGDDAVGYYLSGGKVQKIHWSKADEYSRLKFFDENGKELAINRGKTYIALCGPGWEDIRTED